jgi:hypothetical protein
MRSLPSRLLTPLLALATSLLFVGCGDDSSSPAGTADTTPPATPSGLSLASNVTNVTIEWDDNSEADLAGYIVEKSLDGGATWEDFTDVITTSSYTDALTARADYRVRSTDLVGNESGATAAVTYVLPPDRGPKVPARAR